MKYEDALEIGRRRAEEAADIIRRWSGVQAIAVCAVTAAWVTDPKEPREWKPVGRQSFKDIAWDNGVGEGCSYHLLIVGEDGTAKACSRKRLRLEEILRLVKRLPLPVAAPGWGELWKALYEKDARANGRNPALHVKV